MPPLPPLRLVTARMTPFVINLACDNASRAWDVAVFATAHAVAASSHPAITCRKFRLEGCGTAKAGARLR